ncbi:hypothetical protein AAVH_26640 [Aphelenchoides avenae]|nr:hypothetical protein AAVH_26640 [Aphelenchus avenae]
MKRLDCERIESLVQVDAANSSVLTTSLSAAWNGWSRPDKANFALYKKRIENTVYEPVWTGSEKISAASKILDSYAPDGSSAKDLILAIPIGGFGTFCDFLNCAIRRGLLQATEKDCWKFTPTTTPSLTTTTATPSENLRGKDSRSLIPTDATVIRSTVDS